ncbi:hypothetical protein V757_03070 [Pelistega indica]|uniref:Uncharacterized protein n=1 Tax=Pelistega indica TaxID=1414851 RepID=V8G958_9BURK|nr:hypothetical protein [Pelistega indica]ETD72646.1 hypothetical protein V757_03070 [Pelistega indica]
MQPSVELLENLFNSDFVTFKTGDFYFEETKDQGKGKCTFFSKEPVLSIKAQNKAPLIWSLKNRHCAEGAFLTFQAHGNLLHLIEMKSTLRTRAWNTAKKQFEGMHLSALAIIKLLQLNDPIQIRAYIVYSRDEMRAPDVSSYVINKPLVGEVNKFDGHDWTHSEIELNYNQEAQLIKIQRDHNGDADARHISLNH